MGQRVNFWFYSGKYIKKGSVGCSLGNHSVLLRWNVYIRTKLVNSDRGDNKVVGDSVISVIGATDD